MKLGSEKEFRQVPEVAVAALLSYLGFPSLTPELILWIPPWQPVYRVAGSLREWVLGVQGRNTVKRARGRLEEEAVHVA